MKRILLIAPIPPDAHYMGFKTLSFLGTKAVMTPLHLATVAALTPDDIEVKIWDESIHGRIENATETDYCDLVGITGYFAHAQRMIQIARVFRERSIPVAIGGIGVSTAPARYRDVADVIFIGEVHNNPEHHLLQ